MKASHAAVRPGDDLARVLGFANQVPLLYQQSACCSFKAAIEASWKNYGLTQSRSSLPTGPLVVMIHMASVWVPFTGESGEAIADYDEIRKEMKLALQECGRKRGLRAAHADEANQRRDVFARYIGEIARSCESITGSDAGAVYQALLRTAGRRPPSPTTSSMTKARSSRRKRDSPRTWRGHPGVSPVRPRRRPVRG